MLAIIGAFGTSGVVAAQLQPEDVLTGHGLRRAGTCYVVPTEAEIAIRFANMDPAYNDVVTAMNWVTRALRQEEIVSELADAQVIIQTRIEFLRGQIANPPPTAGVNPTVQELQYALQQAQVALNNVIVALIRERNLLATPDQKEAFWNGFLGARATYLKASKALRPTIDKAAEEYNKLKADADVMNALGVLSQRKKVHYSLGPSKDLKTIVTELKRREQNISLASDSYRSKRKVKSRVQPKRNSSSSPTKRRL